MSATHLNPDIRNTAARYVAKAVTRVHPAQRRELLQEMVRQAEAALAVMGPAMQAAA